MFDYRNVVSLPIVLTRNRLRCWCRFNVGNSKSQWFPCFVDTGAMKTIIPENFWSDYSRRMVVSEKPDSGFRGVGGTWIDANMARLSLEVAGSSDTNSTSANLEDLANKGIVGLGECDVLLALDQTAAQKVIVSATAENINVKALQYILLGLDALICGGVCVNCQSGDAHLLIIQP